MLLSILCVHSVDHFDELLCNFEQFISPQNSATHNKFLDRECNFFLLKIVESLECFWCFHFALVQQFDETETTFHEHPFRLASGGAAAHQKTILAAFSVLRTEASCWVAVPGCWAVNPLRKLSNNLEYSKFLLEKLKAIAIHSKNNFKSSRRPRFYRRLFNIPPTNRNIFSGSL